MSGERGTQPRLTGRKVDLRPWRPDDADAVFVACQDAEIQRWTTVPSPYAHADAVEYVTEVAPAVWKDGGAVFAVVEHGDDVPVGSIGAHAFFDGVAHVGYWTAPGARGRGFTSDALRTVTRWFLRDREAARVELVVEPANLGSVRVAESAGFTAEGTLRQRFVLRGRRADIVMYSLLPGDAAAARL